MCINVNLLSKKKPGTSILDAILDGRGINKEEYLNPYEKRLLKPDIFSDMQRAVNIVKNAIKENQKILVWGDFDADGVTSTSIMCKTLEALGANYSYFLPDRLKLGHGLNLKQLLNEKSKNNIKVLITVDCGISNIKEISVIKSLGVKTIITDHHEPLEVLPDADCILNPLAKNSLIDSLTVTKIKSVSHLAGAGVALKFAYGLLGSEFQKLKKELLVLSAIGTISDVVPLVGENRVIVAKGLVEINNKMHFGVSRLFEKQKIKKVIKSDDVAFILTPRINAAGRLDSPYESIKLLIENNQLAVDMTIEKLNSLNKVRQKLCDKTYFEALKLVKNPDDCIVLYNPDWHIGIIGIVAARLVEKFNMPAFLITKDEKNVFRCSIRSSDDFNVSEILKSMKECFLGYGGHASAGGFSANSEEISIENLKSKIIETVSIFKDENNNKNIIDVDIELTGNDVNEKLLSDIDKMEPFGAKNERPVFLFKNAEISYYRTIGKDANHVSYSVNKSGKEFECLFWRRRVLGFDIGEKIDFVFTPEINSYNDEVKLQLITEHILNDKLQEKYYNGVKLFDHRQKTGIIEKVEGYVKNKNGEVKVWASSFETKKLLDKFPFIKKNFITKDDLKEKQKTVLLFDYPANLEDFKELMGKIKPDNLHLMKTHFSKNPDDYIKVICGMLKFSTNNKNGNISLKTLADNAALDENAVQTLLDILEKLDYIKIEDIDKIFYIKPPYQKIIHRHEDYPLFENELNRIFQFKEYLLTADLKEIESFCKR